MARPTVFKTPLQEVHIDQFSQEDVILDIGGGGEGIVARIGGARVCAIDVKIDEIIEARIYGSPANWIVADGQALCFRNETFNVVTLWFSFGFLRTWDTKRKVLAETYRVLKQKGIVSILAARIDCLEERFFFQAQFVLPDGTVSRVTYGVHGNQEQTTGTIVSLLKSIGFNIINTIDHDYWFKILAVK